MPPTVLENIVILCFERRFSRQDSVIRLKLNILPLKRFGLATPLLLLLRNVVRDSDKFFAYLFSLEVKLLWRNAFACGKGLGR